MYGLLTNQITVKLVLKYTMYRTLVRKKLLFDLALKSARDFILANIKSPIPNPVVDTIQFRSWENFQFEISIFLYIL